MDFLVSCVNTFIYVCLGFVFLLWFFVVVFLFAHRSEVENAGRLKAIRDPKEMC